jgi:hypothetical protein
MYSIYIYITYLIGVLEDQKMVHQVAVAGQVDLADQEELASGLAVSV